MKQVIILFFAIALITSCNNNAGMGGGWSSSERNKYRKQCEDQITATGYNGKDVRPLCDCFIKKVERKYPDAEAADKEKDPESIGAKLMQDCLSEMGLGGNRNQNDFDQDNGGYNKKDNNSRDDNDGDNEDNDNDENEN